MEGGRDDDDEGQSKAKKFKFSYPADSLNSGSMTSSDAVIAVFDKESDSFLCYKPSTKSWYKMQEMNDEMKWEDLNSVVVEDHIYALLWNKSVYRLKYSDMNATWQRMAGMEKYHGWFPPAAVLNGFIYVVHSGYCDASAECEVFDPSNDEWKLISSLNEARSDASVVAAKGYIYCIGGSGGSNRGYIDLNSVERYDPHSNTWSYVASMKQPRSEAAAVEFDGKIYVIGGNYYYQPLSDVECYDSASDTWTWIEPMLTSCGRCTACVLDKKIFVFERNVSEQGLQLFDLSDKKWKYFDEVLDIKTQCSVNSLILPDHSNLVPVRKHRSSHETLHIPKVEAVKENGGIKVSWQKPGIKVFRYLVKVVCDGREIQTSTVEKPEYVFRNCNVFKDYYFKVFSQNFARSYGDFTESNVIRICVSNIVATKKKRGILISWQTHDVSDEDLFCIQAFCDGKELGEIQTTRDSQFLLKSVVRSGTYYFQVWIQSPTVEDKIPSNDIEMITYLDNGVSCDLRRRLRKNYKVFHGEFAGSGVTESVAVKILDFELEPNAKREVQNMVKVINHPNIVLYRVSGEFEGSLGENLSFIAMELCEMKTLWEMVKECSNIKDEYWKTTLLQVTHGLKHIHNHDVIHRDLKPQNILRSLDKKNMKLADFGLSQKIDPDKSMMTKSYLYVGTEGWGAPENYQIDKKMSKWSDVFSLGLIFYYVLSKGKHAFGSEYHRWKINIKDGEGMDLTSSQLKCSDPEIAKDLITNMLERKQKLRPTAEKVLKDPFFWDDKKKLEFLCDVSDSFESVEILLKKQESLTGPQQVILAKIQMCETKARELVKDNWLDKVTLQEEEKEKIPNQSGNGPVYEKASEKKRNKRDYRYNHASVTSLLRFIRNRRHHFKEDGPEMGMIFKNEEDIWRFFSSRFPLLFTFTFSLLKGVQGFERYLMHEAENKLLPENPEYGH